MTTETGRPLVRVEAPKLDAPTILGKIELDGTRTKRFHEKKNKTNKPKIKLTPIARNEYTFFIGNKNELISRDESGKIVFCAFHTKHTPKADETWVCDVIKDSGKVLIVIPVKMTKSSEDNCAGKLEELKNMINSGGLQENAMINNAKRISSINKKNKKEKQNGNK